MKNKHLRDISLYAGIEHARGLQEAQGSKTPGFLPPSFINATIEDATIEGCVARYVAPENLLRGTVFVAKGQECYLVRVPNRHGYAWFANRFYVVSHDTARGYLCSCPNEGLRPFVIEQVKKFVADNAA